MKYFPLQDIIALHDAMIATMQGLKGIEPSRIVYLESALNHIQNDDFYPLFVDKLTHLFFACIQFHLFLDGNKRTALLVAKLFIELNLPNHLSFDFYQQLENVAVAVADGKMNKEELKHFFKKILG